MKTKTSVKAGGRGFNHNQSGLAVRTRVQAGRGALISNHASSALRVRTSLESGSRGPSCVMRKSLLLVTLALPILCADVATPPLTLEQKEEFLRKATIKERHGAKKGVTGTIRATLTDGTLTHDASIQRIDEEKARFETDKGVELGFRDTYRFNIAAYRLAGLLGLQDMMPPSVERSFEGTKGSFTWWVEDVQMDETERVKRKIEAPDKERWARQYLIMKVFDQLIFNTDRNQQNILYDKNWKLWMIDHSRAFRIKTNLQDPKALEKCDRVLLQKLKDLNEKDVKAAIGNWVRPGEIKALMARRNLIVAYFEKAGPDKQYDFLGQ